MYTASWMPTPLLPRANKKKAFVYIYPVTCTSTRVVLRDSSPVELLHHSCTCVAGAALCNHCVALLFQSAHYSQLKVPVVPPMLSCTEGEQQWHKPRTLGIKPGPVDKMAVLSAKPKCGGTREGVRSTLYKGLSGDLPDLSVLQVTEVYKNFSAAEALMICSMGISSEVPLVDSALGPVQAGSPLSYQQPARVKKDLSFHAAPPPPSLSLQNYHLQPPNCMFVCSEAQQLHLKSLEVSWDMAHKFECATREQSSCSEWHQLRRPRLTASRFREICQVRESNEDSLADWILQGTRQTAAMKRGLELEADVIWEYCQMKRVNHYPCGFVIHPDAPWLGASPDGLIFDPSEPCQFGLIEMKCPNVKSYVDCPYLSMNSGKLELKQSHAYYAQVQGQMLITGMNWCDFVVSAEEDILIQRIYRDRDMLDVIKEKVDWFYFHVYMQKCM
ncbi:uncharacterized protein LOC121643962 isoform X2 [Melanotaenia boesemani]|uniref:uncharacterized protein LOC121643962 isoform X2 n=1 Tax=Melanotaenia boesemani TaxID=1250792 RepID=UPI001C05D006|nr:uncharacterized protein LOC121643962 isoform X2 [Melanotaenia boesemani]